MAGIKRTKYDDIFSKLVRERADFQCEYCGKDYRNRPQGLHCSHLQGRRSKSTRWHPDNAFAHCYACHQYLGANPAEYSLWAQNELGEDRLWEIVRKSKAPMKIKAPEMEQLYSHMKDQYQAMLQKRLMGHVGRIDFTTLSWYE